MALTYGSNYTGKKLGRSNQVTTPSTVKDDYDPLKYGAAGRGEYYDNAATYEAASKTGLPMSTAEAVTKTKEGSALVESIQNRNRATRPADYKTTQKNSKVDRTSALKRSTGVSGLRTTSAGATYGSAGRNTMGTSAYDAAGNTIVGTAGGRNVIGGAPKGIDRSAGIYQDPIEEYMKMLSPQSVIDRQKAIRGEIERDRQSQIDAIRQKYSAQVADEQAVGAEDLARQRSLNLRAGLGGSDFGAANKIEVRDRTRSNIKNIEAGRDLEIAGIIDSIDQLANQRFQIEQNALQQGFSDAMGYNEYVQEQTRQQRTQAVESIKQLGMAGLDIATIKSRDPQLYANIAASSGMGDVELEAVLNNNKPAPAKIDYQYKVAGGKIIAFGVDPTTGQLKMLEQEAGLPDNYKTLTADDGTILGIPENWDGDTSKIVTVGNYRKPFASEIGGGVGGQELPLQAQSSALMSQETYSKLTAKQKTQADSLNNLVRTLKEYKTYLDSNTGGSGINLFGEDAAVLQTKLNSIIFAAAQAEGTGALQQADREVIEKIIPNPTSLGGALNALRTGGKAGELKKIEDQINKYTGNLKTYGLTPTNENIVGGTDTGQNEVEVRAPNGTVGTIPANQLQQALSEGYTQL